MREGGDTKVVRPKESVRLVSSYSMRFLEGQWYAWRANYVVYCFWNLDALIDIMHGKCKYTESAMT